MPQKAALIKYIGLYTERDMEARGNMLRGRLPVRDRGSDWGCKFTLEMYETIKININKYKHLIKYKTESIFYFMCSDVFY